VQRFWRGISGVALALALAFALLAGCAGSQNERPLATSTPALPTLTLPPVLHGQHVFVADLVTGNLAELGAATTHVSRSVHGLGLSHDSRWLFVTDVAGNRLVAYALKDGALGESHAVPVGAQPVHMVETSDGRRLFVTDFAGKSVSVVNTASGTLEKTIATPDAPHSVVLSPDGRWAYVGCYGAASVVVIDAASATLAGTITLPVGAQPYGLALSKDGRILYASDNLTGRLFVIDVTLAPSGRVTGAVEVGLRPALIARSPDATALYVSSGASHSVTVVSLAPDPAHPTVRATIPVSGYPHGLAVTPDGKYVVMANTTGKTLSVIETATNTIVATVQGEQYPNDVLILP
jgi:YVTN family beta-propeller protein